MSQLKCRFCQNELKDTFCDLGLSPRSNFNLKEEDLNKKEPFFPLHAYVCDQCFLVQLGESESADTLFHDEYAYFSSFSESWLKHCESYVEMMTSRFHLNTDCQVIEVASNDGYLLKYFVKKGVPVLGVEPCSNVAKAAIEGGVPTLVKFFGVQTAKELADQGKKADLLLGNNVLAHVPDINDFVAGMKVVLKDGGVITMEFPHLLRMMQENQFDTIYHEHYSYLSFIAVEQIFSKHGITLFDVDELPTHGGSLRIYGRHNEDSSKQVTERVRNLKQREIEFGLKDLQTYKNFGQKVTQTKKQLIEFLQAAKKEGKKVVGYGAPAKGNTLLNFCAVGTDFISYTVDRSPHKQGKYLPGTHIPIRDPAMISRTKPDYLLILPWNLKEEIMDQMSDIRSWGGKFVVPIPMVEVLN